MGELRNNNVMGTASGKVGLVVFRQVRGKLIASNLPPRGRSSSPGQKVVLARFKRASRYAKAALADATLNDMYTARVGGKLFTPRLVAMSDYLNAPVINKIDVSAYKGAVGDVITIDAEDDFFVKRVRVNILSAGVVVETGDAVEDPIKMSWSYKATAAAAPGGITLQITAFDMAGNETTVEKSA